MDATEPKREKHIPEALGHLSGALNRLEETIGRLATQLSSVLRPAVLSVGPGVVDDAKPAVSDCALAAEITENMQRVVQLVSSIDSLSNRLEV